MTTAEQVTDFKLDGATYDSLCRALTEHCRRLGIEAEEYGISAIHSNYGKPIPKNHWLVAFCVEGSNEGYYVHIAAISGPFQPSDPKQRPCRESHYTGIGLAKMYTPELSYRMMVECQRFLTAANWN